MNSILSLYPHLDPSKKAAQNIRADLKKNFPNTKFSVTSDHSSVNIRYEDGAALGEVEELVNKYQYGSFDSMDDMYNYKKSDFTEIFQGIKYVFVSRSYSDVAIQKALDVVNEFNNTKYLVSDYKSGCLWKTEYTDYTKIGTTLRRMICTLQ